jgi:hypothetical protein
MINFYLYISILIAAVFLRDLNYRFFGSILIGMCLINLDLPDILEYKSHYSLASQIGFEDLLLSSNFEPGYVLLVYIISNYIPFEFFYVVVIALAIDAYSKFYALKNDERYYIYIIIFLSTCLYFVAFTIRSTIASIFLAYALIYFRQRKLFTGSIMILAGSAFHVAILPMLMFPVINNISFVFEKKSFYIYAMAILASIFLPNFLLIDSFVGMNKVLDLKILAYEDANINSSSLFFGLWIFVAAGFVMSYRSYDDFDRSLFVTLFVIILFLRSYGFIQGRFMWLTSFLFVYFFAKSLIFKFDIGKYGRLLLIFMLPLMNFLRF